MRTLIEQGARRLARARVFFGHGTDNAFDESAALVCMRSLCRTMRAQASTRARSAPPGPPGRVRSSRAASGAHAGGLPHRHRLVCRSCLQRRSARAHPALAASPSSSSAVLPPGSCRARAPGARPRHRLRLHRHRLRDGAAACARGCGRCLARGARGCDANVRRHRLGAARAADGLGPLRRPRRQDATILSSATRPMSARARCARLPAEYRHEPRMASRAGSAGLDSVRVILAQAARHLTPRGCWWSRWEIPRGRCDGRSAGCPSCGSISSAAGAGCSC